MVSSWTMAGLRFVLGKHGSDAVTRGRLAKPVVFNLSPVQKWLCLRTNQVYQARAF